MGPGTPNGRISAEVGGASITGARTAWGSRRRVRAGYGKGNTNGVFVGYMVRMMILGDRMLYWYTA